MAPIEGSSSIGSGGGPSGVQKDSGGGSSPSRSSYDERLASTSVWTMPHPSSEDSSTVRG